MSKIEPTAEEILDMIWDAICDSFGPDWNTRLAARAVLERLTDEGLIIVPANIMYREEAAAIRALKP